MPEISIEQSKSKEYEEAKERFFREELWDVIQSYKDYNLKHAIETKHEFREDSYDKLIDAIYDNKV